MQWLILGSVLLLLAAAYKWLSSLPVLPMYLIGCEIHHSDGSCTPRETGPLRIWIPESPRAKIAIRDDGLHRLPAHKLKVKIGDEEFDTDGVRELDKPSSAGAMTVYALEGLLLRQRTIPIRPRLALNWVDEAWAVRNSEQQDAGKKAEERLHKHEADAERLSGQTLARYLSLKAQLAAEFDRPGWEALFQKALQVNHAMGLLSEEVEDVLWLSERLAKHLGRVTDAEKQLQKYHAIIETLPEWRPWELQQQALYKSMRGDLRGALGILIEGRQFARRTGNLVGLHDLNKSGADLLSRLGRLDEAMQWLAEVPPKDMGACRNIEWLFAQSKVWLQARELDSRRPLSISLRNPKDLSSDALALVKTCDQPRQAELAYTYQALAALQQGDYDTAVKRIELARKNPAKKDNELDAARLYVLGESALGQQRWEDARTHFDALEDLGRANVLIHVQWQAKIGLAQRAEHLLHAGDSIAEVQELYQEAESLADRESLAAPLGLGSGSYLGRYERGTVLYLDLLLRQGDLGTALNVIRHARVRSIQALTALERLANMQAPEKQAYAALIEGYEEVRAEINRIVRKEGVATEEDAGKLRSEHVKLSAQALKYLEDALKLGGASALGAEAHREPDDHEALLACHPVTKGWVCLFSYDKKIERADIDFADIEDPRSQERLAAVLLTPFASRLQVAKTLTVIAYGAMRDIDIHLLPFGSKHLSLQEQKEVLYALDLPGARHVLLKLTTPSGAETKAYALLNPEEQFPELNKTQQPISDSLKSLGFIPNLQVGGARAYGGEIGSNRTSAKTSESPLTSERVRDSIKDSTLFHVAAHVNYSQPGDLPPTLRLSDDVGLMASDILALPQVPRYATLFACESGRTKPEWGSIEQLGLAQAFIAHGHGSEWVLGTSRPIAPALAAEISTAFYRELASSRDAMEALRYAVTHSQFWPPDPNRKITKDNDVGAFRLYVP